MTESVPIAGPIDLTRTYDAPREAVFAAWTTPEAFSEWFIVDGYSTPADRITMDVRAGGVLAAVMVADADGSEVLFNATYAEADPPSRLVIDFSGAVDETSTITFTEADGQTTMDFHQVGTPVAKFEEATEGWRAMFEAIAAVIAKS